MYSISKVSCAVAAILSGATAAAPRAARASTSSVDASDQLQTITVTAQRREQNIQDVPITMQALTAERLSQLSATTFDDYVRYLPNVSVASNGPGQDSIFMRGVDIGGVESQESGSVGFFPNVAIYLDNQSVQLPALNLDVYAADLDRIEILEGPQGTLFGAGAEAGVVRYITNQPKLNTTEGNVNAGYGVTAHGNPNTNLTAVLNLPLITDKLAIRGVIYNDSRGGYIDNVPATFTRKSTDIGIHYANYPTGCVQGGATGVPACEPPPGAPVINNYNIAANAINPVTYKGGRVEALYQINDDWNFLLTQMYQNMDSQGVFYEMPKSSDGTPLQPLEVTLFNNAQDEDRFENTAWTLNGKLGALKAVYTGGYLVRNVHEIGDYTNYARGVYSDYYQCYGPGRGGDANLTSTCYSPSQVWKETERNEHMSHEFRLSTPDDWRARGIVGVFYEDNKILDQTNWFYKTIPPCTSNGPPGTPGNTACLSNAGTAPGATVQTAGALNDATAFSLDTTREVKQTAFFVSFDYDIIPKVLTITVGTRHYDFENSLKGDNTSSFYCWEQGAPAGGCILNAINLDEEHLSDTESGFKSRANLTWRITPNAMVYYTWSQGFRPGGFNRNGGSQYIDGPDGVPQFVLPRSYLSDSLTNNELGWKTELFGRRLQWDGALYQEDWTNAQVEFFDPTLTGDLAFGTNGQNFRIRGIENSIIARVTNGLTLQGAATWNHSVQTNSPALTDGNPASVNYGKQIMEACDSSGGNCAPVSNIFGPIGAPTANSPPIQFSLHARYERSFDDYDAFVQFGATHTGHSFTQAGANPPIAATGAISTLYLRFENPAYSTFDASLGVAKDAWSAHVYAQNLANSHATTFTSTDQFVVASTVLRPRVIGVVFTYKY